MKQILRLLSGLAPRMSWVGRYPGSTQEASYFLTHSEQYELAYFALRDPRFVLNMEYLIIANENDGEAEADAPRNLKNTVLDSFDKAANRS
ncbi:hypothetical protein HYQ46_013376 [Verticillium longisporum]|nr:hypothetical protein HYQ46_013376 [Verticillium longisporum]